MNYLIYQKCFLSQTISVWSTKQFSEQLCILQSNSKIAHCFFLCSMRITFNSMSSINTIIRISNFSHVFLWTYTWAYFSSKLLGMKHTINCSITSCMFIVRGGNGHLMRQNMCLRVIWCLVCRCLNLWNN